MSVKHLATLRFAYATFKVSNISRACSHQLVRHPHLSYLQRSQRYCNDAESGFVLPDSLADNQVVFEKLLADSLKVYKELIDYGVPKGDARYVLPQAASTELYVTGNFQAWTTSYATEPIRRPSRRLERLLFQ